MTRTDARMIAEELRKQMPDIFVTWLNREEFLQRMNRSKSWLIKHKEVEDMAVVVGGTPMYPLETIINKFR